MHQEYVRRVPGAKTAVMFIHGIVGTPNHFTDLLPLVEMVPSGCTVYNVLLDGHGGTVEDFTHTSMNKWKSQVWRIFNDLQAGHEEVILVGHSMGTLFSLQLAAQHPDKIKRLVLFACPLYARVRLAALVNSTKVALNVVDTNNPQQVATAQACGVYTEKKLWKYILWLPRMLELLREIHDTRKIIDAVQIPVAAFQSCRDELVSNRAGKLLERNKWATVYYLKGSSHYYYDRKDMTQICSYFTEIMKQYKKQD